MRAFCFVCMISGVCAVDACCTRSRATSALLDAVKRRDEKAFAALLRAKADVNAAQPDGATALAWAVHLGERRMAEALLDAGANADTADEYGETPVTLAAANGDAGLVAAAADRRRQRARGAMERRDGTDDCRGRRESRHRAPAGAARRRRERGGAARRSDGADVGGGRRPRRRRGRVGRRWAPTSTRRRRPGSRRSSLPRSRTTCRRSRRCWRRAPIRTSTLASGAKPLMVAMQYGHTAAALALLDGGADITARDRAGNTALHLASQEGDLRLVRALLAKGVDPNARTPKSTAPAGARGGGGGGRGGVAGEQTPLMLAARADHDEVMRALVAAGADPSLRAQDGASLLMAAASGARLQDVHLRLRARSGRRRRDGDRQHA